MGFGWEAEKAKRVPRQPGQRTWRQIARDDGLDPDMDPLAIPREKYPKLYEAVKDWAPTSDQIVIPKLRPHLPPHYGHEILRCEVGSTLHGTGLPGHEDHDEMGIYVETKAGVLGFDTHEHYVARTAPEGQRSQPTDTDLTMYGLRKWSRLAHSGNPSVLLLLYAPDDKVMFCDAAGAEVRHNANLFASKRAGTAFLGYMEQQRQRMVGQRGRAGRVRVMPDGGVDWKYAMHMLRLGYQGREYLRYGTLTVPVPGTLGDHLRAVRRGELPFSEVISEAEGLEADVQQLLVTSELPPEPNTAAIERLLIDLHDQVWAPSPMMRRTGWRAYGGTFSS